MKGPHLCLATAVAVALLPLPCAQAQDAYKIGVTGAMTGPGAPTQAPVVEMLRIYVDRLNAKGGIGGHKIDLIVEDDQAAPSRAAANVIKLVRQDNVSLLINSSFSSTYGPVIAESERANVPLWFAGAVCPKETHPPTPNPVMFCSTAFDFALDIPFAVDAIRQMAKQPVKIGLIGMTVPISRIGIANAAKKATGLGMIPVDSELIAPSVADYTPFATKLNGANPNWALAYAPWPTEVKTFEAMRRLGWKGSYVAYGHVQAEEDLKRVADGDFQVFAVNAFFNENLLVQREIEDAAKAGRYSYPVSYGAEGWVTGEVLEQILRRAAWPVTPAKVTEAMENLNLDTQGLRGGPLVWTKNNHFRTRQYYRFYRYDPTKKSIVRMSDWQAVDVGD